MIYVSDPDSCAEETIPSGNDARQGVWGWVIGSVRNEGGGGGRGVNTPPYLHRTLAFVLSKGTQGGSLKDPPPPNIKMSFMNCFKLLSITRNKTCYKDKWVTLKTVPVA